jgi:hypothetical protein
MEADINTLRDDLWNGMMDNVESDHERFIALLYHLTANEGRQDWEDVDNMIGEDYLVLTDKEADDMVRDYIDESAGMFTPSFLSGFTGIDEDVFVALQETGKYDAIRSMIQDFDAFVKAAVEADGRGHFLATYDFNEYDVAVRDSAYSRFATTYYIYRVN